MSAAEQLEEEFATTTTVKIGSLGASFDVAYDPRKTDWVHPTDWETNSDAMVKLDEAIVAEQARLAYEEVMVEKLENFLSTLDSTASEISETSAFASDAPEIRFTTRTVEEHNWYYGSCSTKNVEASIVEPEFRRYDTEFWKYCLGHASQFAAFKYYREKFEEAEAESEACLKEHRAFFETAGEQVVAIFDREAEKLKQTVANLPFGWSLEQTGNDVGYSQELIKPLRDFKAAYLAALMKQREADRKRDDILSLFMRVTHTYRDRYGDIREKKVPVPRKTMADIDRDNVHYGAAVKIHKKIAEYRRLLKRLERSIERRYEKKMLEKEFFMHSVESHTKKQRERKERKEELERSRLAKKNRHNDRLRKLKAVKCLNRAEHKIKTTGKGCGCMNAARTKEKIHYQTEQAAWESAVRHKKPMRIVRCNAYISFHGSKRKVGGYHLTSKAVANDY